MKSVPKKVREIQEWKANAEKDSKSISFSQLSTYVNCPLCWYRTYVTKEAPYVPGINATFGTAFHETLQSWLDVLYNKSVKEANTMDLAKLLQDNLKKVYKSESKKYGKHFSTAKELGEFYEDGRAILDYIVKHRKSYFSSKGTYLVGCEIPLLYKLQDKFYFKGYIDVLLYDKELDTWYIFDIKTSTRGWNQETKKDEVKASQVILYREFLSKQFDIPADKIKVEYFIVKRKVFEDAEYASAKKRVQEFVPACGPRKTKQALERVNRFLVEVLTEDGKYQEREYPAYPSDKNCRWCVFKDTCKKL